MPSPGADPTVETSTSQESTSRGGAIQDVQDAGGELLDSVGDGLQSGFDILGGGANESALGAERGGINIHMGGDGLPFPGRGKPTVYVMREGQTTSEGQLTKDWLRRQGYVRVGSGVGCEIWDHPTTGDRVMLFPPKTPPDSEDEPSNAPSSDGPDPEETDESEPAITRARDEADLIATKKARVLNDLQHLKTLLGKPGYDAAKAQLLDEWNDLDNEVRAADSDMKQWEDDLEDEANAGRLDEQLERIREVKRWMDEGAPTEFWQELGKMP
jgi:hypothetical protein